MSAAVAELRRLDVVYVSELAYASHLSERTIRDRLALYREDPDNPRAIPYLVHLGKPYRITRETAKRLLSETHETA